MSKKKNVFISVIMIIVFIGMGIASVLGVRHVLHVDDRIEKEGWPQQTVVVTKVTTSRNDDGFDVDVSGNYEYEGKTYLAGYTTTANGELDHKEGDTFKIFVDPAAPENYSVNPRITTITRLLLYIVPVVTIACMALLILRTLRSLKKPSDPEPMVEG